MCEGDEEGGEPSILATHARPAASDLRPPVWFVGIVLASLRQVVGQAGRKRAEVGACNRCAQALVVGEPLRHAAEGRRRDGCLWAAMIGPPLRDLAVIG